MAISKENKEFIDSLIEYYITESESYRQIAENFLPEVILKFGVSNIIIKHNLTLQIL